MPTLGKNPDFWFHESKTAAHTQEKLLKLAVRKLREKQDEIANRNKKLKQEYYRQLRQNEQSQKQMAKQEETTITKE